MEEAKGSGGDTSDATSLGEELLQTRQTFCSLLQPPLHDSTVLHPLYDSKRQHLTVDRDTFSNHLKKIRFSLKAYQERSAFINEGLVDLPQASSSTLQPQEGAKRQKVHSLLREASSHTSAISLARLDLDGVAALGSDDISLQRYLGEDREEPARESLAPNASQSEAEERVKLLTKACEYIVKGLGMEIFAEQHNKDERKVYALTLAASILVIDVEIELAPVLQTESHPNVQVRLSYATDSASDHPRSRDPRLADCLREDLQEVTNLIYATKGDTLAAAPMERADKYIVQIKRNLSELKSLDDASKLLIATMPKPSTMPDLFAAMDAFCSDLQSAVDKLQAAGDVNPLGRLLLHVGSPYATLVYHGIASLPFVTDKELCAFLGNLHINGPHLSKSNLHTLHVTIKYSKARLAATDSKRSALPNLGPNLRYVAMLNKPVPMSRSMAKRLADAAGFPFVEEGISRKERPQMLQSQGHLNSAEDVATPSFERLLAEGHELGRVSDHNLYFASAELLPGETHRQGVLVSEFAFASIDHLCKSIEILRQQAKLNNMIATVAINADKAEGKGRSFEKDDLNPPGKAVNLVSVKYEGDYPIVLISVPLSRKQYMLEMKLTSQQKESWDLHASVFSLADPFGKRTVLDQSDELHRQIVAELARESANMLELIVTRIKEWALRTIQENLSMRGSEWSNEVSEVAEESSANTAARQLSPANKTRRRSSASNDNDKLDRGISTKRTASQASIDADAHRDNRRKV